jgi:hypothetical protein
MTLTNQNWVHGEIKSSLNSGNLNSVQNLMSSCFLFKNIKHKIYKKYNSHAALNRHETWYLTLREEHRLRVFKNEVLREIFRPKRKEVTGGRRKLHNEESQDLYTSQSINRVIKSRRMRSVGHMACVG